MQDDDDKVPNAGQVGRPTKCTKRLTDLMCAQIAEGVSLRTVCKQEDMPSKTTVFKWLRTVPEFLDQYTRAREAAADALIEECLDIADDGSNDWYEKQIGGEDGITIQVPDHEHINRSRLRVDTRKWIASKLKPKKYGDKLALGGDEDGAPIQYVFRDPTTPPEGYQRKKR